MNQDYRQFLLNMLPKQSIGAEVGVHLGDFSAQIINSLEPKELHLIDPWEYQSGETYRQAWYGGVATGGQPELDDRYLGILRRFEPNIKSNQVKVHRGYSSDMLLGFPDGYLDWIYIDGNHLYEFVKQDLEMSLRKVKTGGYITGDDYCDGGWWDGGVKKAVDEFGNRPDVQLILIQNQQFIFIKNH